MSIKRWEFLDWVIVKVDCSAELLNIVVTLACLFVCCLVIWLVCLLVAWSLSACVPACLSACLPVGASAAYTGSSSSAVMLRVVCAFRLQAFSWIILHTGNKPDFGALWQPLLKWWVHRMLSELSRCAPDCCTKFLWIFTHTWNLPHVRAK